MKEWVRLGACNLIKRDQMLRGAWTADWHDVMRIITTVDGSDQYDICGARLKALEVSLQGEWAKFAKHLQLPNRPAYDCNEGFDITRKSLDKWKPTIWFEDHDPSQHEESCANPECKSHHAAHSMMWEAMQRGAMSECEYNPAE